MKSQKRVKFKTMQHENKNSNEQTDIKKIKINTNVIKIAL